MSRLLGATIAAMLMGGCMIAAMFMGESSTTKCGSRITAGRGAKKERKPTYIKI